MGYDGTHFEYNYEPMKRLFAILLLALPLLFTQCRQEPAFVKPEEAKSGQPTDISEDNDDADDVNWAAAMSYVFDAGVIPEIHITVSETQWNKLLAAYDKNSDTQDFVECDVRYVKGAETVEISRTGLRLKGNTSRRRPMDNGGGWHHCHYGLDFHKYEKDAAHTLKGVRRVDLKWFKDDPAYVREIYCYDLFRRYGVWTAVNDVYSRLWIKVGNRAEAYLGVYGMLEHVDKNYLRVRRKDFGDEDGNLWKCRYPADLRDVNADFGVDDNVHDHTYVLKTNKTDGFAAAKAQMQDFIGKLNSLSGAAFNQWFASVMDVDLFLKTYAVNVAVGMWDDYWNNSNNYYLYFNSTDSGKYRVFFIPYDYDNTLGTSAWCGVQGDSGRQDPLNWGHDDYPLMTKVLANSEWKEKYKGYLRELCAQGGLFYWSNSDTRIKAWQKSIRDFVSNDTGEDMSINDQPAFWGNHYEYRIMDTGSSNNFFKVKASSVAAMK